MNVPTPELEIKKIFEKSVKLLKTKENQLSTARDVLKKTVIRLSLALRGSDKEINNILNKMEYSVDDVSLESFDRHLVHLSVLTNGFGQVHKLGDGAGFYSNLISSFEEFQWLECSEISKAKVKLLVEKKLPDKEISLELLNIINDANNKNKSVIENDNVNLLIKDITDATGFEYYRNNNDASYVLKDVTLELVKYICTINNNLNKGDLDQLGKDEEIVIKINSVLVDIISGLSLENDEARRQQIDLLQMLDQPDNTQVFWNNVSEKVISLVNQSIVSLRKKNNDLQGFILKINKQLYDIKDFMRQAQLDNSESANRLLNFQESMETNVDHIQDKVSTASNVNDLKKDISVYLTNIRTQVEDNRFAEKEKEKISAQGYAQVIGELTNTQEEVSSLKAQLEETKCLLLRDSLTGLYNRLAYEDRFQVEVSRNRRTKSPLCLAMWDIDFFKKINDNYGHDVGDRVLKSFSELVQTRIRKTDMFARIGGEEFVLIMPDTSANLALSFINDLRETLSKCKFYYNDTSFFVTVSIGIVELHEDDNPEELLIKADKALYKSKENGRNRCTIFEKNDIL